MKKKIGLTGLSDKLANTATGKLSTFMDNFRRSLADLVGITNSGKEEMALCLMFL